MSKFTEFMAQLSPVKGRILGTMFGLFIGILVLKYGLFRALVVAFFVSIGYYFGQRMDRQETLPDLWERLWQNRDGRS
jgi:uncharacterized membrane protein